MSIVIVTPPASEPLSRAEAKLFLRVDHDAEDDLIEGLVRAAREAVEAYAGRALVTRRVREIRDHWGFDAAGAVSLALAPVVALVALRVADAAGVMQTVSAVQYMLATREPPRIAFKHTPNHPATSIAGVEIEYDVGYGEDAADTPEALRQAVRLTLAAAYENRDGAVALPEGARALLAPYRGPRL